MSNAQLDALIAYEDAVNTLIEKLLDGAVSRDLGDSVSEIRRRMDALHLTLVPGAEDRPHLTLVKS